MEQRLRDYYIESQVNNATPGQMLLMLYDCLLERAEVAEQGIATPVRPGDYAPAAHEVKRCINILTELSTCLRRNVHPTLCAQLGDLYRFFASQFSEALEAREAGKIREILPLLRKLRETWAEADRRANKYQPGSIAVAA
jgi:flagellar biosynthetic protein FliS